MCISGGSAGGYTTLACLAFRDVFSAGASLYGVADLGLLAAGLCCSLCYLLAAARCSASAWCTAVHCCGLCCCCRCMQMNTICHACFVFSLLSLGC